MISLWVAKVSSWEWAGIDGSIDLTFYPLTRGKAFDYVLLKMALGYIMNMDSEFDACSQFSPKRCRWQL